MMRKYWNNLRGEGKLKTRLQGKRNNNHRRRHRIYADVVVLKATETKQLYGKLESFGQTGRYHEIGINWNKIAILTRALNREVWEIRKIPPQQV